MTARKKRRTHSRTTNHKSSSLGSIAFICLLAIATAGWWYVPHGGRSSLDKSQPRSHLQQAAINNKTVTPRIKPLITPASVVDRPPLPAMSVQSKRAQKPPANPDNKSLPPVPYKTDKHLPPAGRFNAHNGANIVFSRQAMVIFSNKSKKSPRIAIVPKGQEMRSYEKNGAWHRIVIPSTNIIGWAEADQLTKQAPFFRHDNQKTGSIK